MNLHSIRKVPFVFKSMQLARRVLGRLWMRLCNRVFGVAPKRVFFSSFKGKAYSDSPRCISEALHAQRPDIEIVWQLADASAAPEYVRAVKPRSPAALRELATARCFVDNFNRQQYLLKFPGQLYVQTWHGDRGFKKMMYDMDDGVEYPDGGQMDLAVSGSRFGTELYRSAFRYFGEVMQLGMPRNDALVNPDPAKIAALRKKLNVPEGARVLLYAPTFRDSTAGGAQQAGFDLALALRTLEESTGARWVCFTRAHDQNSGVATGASGMIDMTAYPEMSELLLVSDLLITDYSSSAGDYVLLDRPVILFQPDLADFSASDRNMYFDIRACGHLRAESESELMEMLASFDRLPKRGAEVLAFYGATESGRSAWEVARWISGKIPQ